MPSFYEPPASSLPAPLDCDPVAGRRREGEAKGVGILLDDLQIDGYGVVRDPALVGAAKG